MATTFSASLRPTRTRILLIALTVALLLGYGLFTAQRARSATLAKKAFAGVEVSGGTATLFHPVHVTGVSYVATGQYQVTFDRHVDNCSMSVTSRFEGGSSSFNQFRIGPGFSTSQINVVEANATASSLADGDFDIIALCPGT